MEGVTFLQISNLRNVAGRIDYITNPERQEHLYATYETAPQEFWRDLSDENRRDFIKFGTTGKCIEAREIVLALPKDFTKYEPEEMLIDLTEKFKDKYKVECVSAIHHNKTKTNLHMHLIFSEREKLPEPIEKIATRTMYFDKKGKKVRTKKEAMNENGKLKRGYKMIPKGEVYERTSFAPKKKLFKDKGFLDEIKEFYTEIMNQNLSERNQMNVFPKNSPLLATKKIGKNNPMARDIALNNWLRDEWNKNIMKLTYYEAPKEKLFELKKDLVSAPFSEIMKEPKEKRTPEKFKKVLADAARTLKAMVITLRKEPRSRLKEIWGELFGELLNYCKRKAPSVILEREDRERERSR